MTRSKFPPASFVNSSIVQLCPISSANKYGNELTSSVPFGVLSSTKFKMQIQIYLTIVLETYKLMPSKPDPRPTESIPAIFFMWFKCSKLQIFENKKKKKTRNIYFSYFSYLINSLEMSWKISKIFLYFVIWTNFLLRFFQCSAIAISKRFSVIENWH
jgi:hypothetical protein